MSRAALRSLALLLTELVTVSTPALLFAQTFQPQTRLGASLPGDTWEPSIAADRYGHVYALIPDFPPSCKGCPSSIAYLVVSNNNGKTWSAPRQIAEPGSGQIDVQVKVDPIDGKTVYASWLQNSKSLIEVAKSTDFGKTWTTVIANSTNAGTDKDILAVRGNDVYVAYDHSQTVWCSSSHDGGQTWTSVKVNANAQFGWSLTGGGTVDPAGNVYFAWTGYTQNGQAKGPANIYVTKSSDGGQTWTSNLLDISSSPPDRSAYSCGWAFLGPGIAMTSDAAGQLYVLWNSGTVDRGPERIYFSTSTDQGNSWTPKTNVSLSPSGANHAFPSVAAGAAGTYGSPGWISAISRTGTSTIGAPRTAAPVGRAKPCSRPTWPGTVTFSQTASASRLATTSTWISTTNRIPRQPGVRVTAGSHPATSGTRASCAENDVPIAGKE
jgi:BNR repeat-like domain